MYRPSFRAAALAAVAFFLVAVGNARADTAQVATDAASQAAQQTAATDSTASNAAPAQPVSTPTNAPASAPSDGGATTTGGSADNIVTVSPEPTANVPAAQVEESSSAVIPAGDTTPPSGGPPPPDASQHGTMSTVVASVPVEPTKSTPIGGVPAPRVPSHPTGGLQQLVPRVERQLLGVQAQIDDLRHRLDQGLAPPESRLIRLRSSLQQITPALLALGSRLDAAGQLSPSLREHLRSLRERLGQARASAADLITALRRVGMHGPQLEMLLRELESFNAMHVGLGSTLDPSLARVPSGLDPGLMGGGAQLLRAPFVPQLAVAPPQARPADGGSAGSAEPGGADSPSPWSSALGSATASAGGAFSAAGVALLATLLIGFTLPQLRTRLELPRRRRYRVAFLTPLERPG